MELRGRGKQRLVVHIGLQHIRVAYSDRVVAGLRYRAEVFLNRKWWYCYGRFFNPSSVFAREQNFCKFFAELSSALHNASGVGLSAVRFKRKRTVVTRFTRKFAVRKEPATNRVSLIGGSFLPKEVMSCVTQELPSR